jgi:hypothetical protein
VTNARFCLIGIAGNSSFFQLVFKHSGNSWSDLIPVIFRKISFYSKHVLYFNFNGFF